MDRNVWRRVKAAVKRACRKNKVERLREPTFSDVQIMLMYLWCIWHDRCLSWACDKSHYGDLFRPRKLPSISQFSRRVREDHFQKILQAVHEELARDGLNSPIHYTDGKPITVGPVNWKHRKNKRIPKLRACRRSRSRRCFMQNRVQHTSGVPMRKSASDVC